MTTLWFVSDTHFNQPNILKFLKKDGGRLREFDDVHEMNERMVEGWNSDIRDHDSVIHMGDVFFGNRDDYEKNIHRRLKGRKSLILGNHDRTKDMYGLFHSISASRRFTEHGFIATHIPLHRESCYDFKRDRYLVNVHGHLHDNVVPDPGYLNICVEKTNYRPISLEEVVEKMKHVME